MLFDKKSRNFGVLCAVISAVAYGTNPLGAVSLYAEQVSPATVLSLRFALAVPLLAAVMLLTGRRLTLPAHDLLPAAVLGVLFTISSQTYYMSFQCLSVGIAVTLLFVYPLMVALLELICFKAPLSAGMMAALALTLTGVVMLNDTAHGVAFNLKGVTLVLLSALAYAGYIVYLNHRATNIPSLALTLWVMGFCALCQLVLALVTQKFTLGLPVTAHGWFYAFFLALVPTVMALLFLTLAVDAIGSLKSSVIGALEPVTGVLVGILAFGEILTLRQSAGIAIILTAVILCIHSRHAHHRHLSFHFLRRKRHHT